MLTAFTDVGQQVLVLFILISVGGLMTKLGMINGDGASAMTDVVLYAVTPCVIIHAFQRDFDPGMVTGLLIAFGAAVATMVFSILFAEILYHRYDISKGAVLKFTVVFSNCGFMALPLQQAVLGDDGVFYGAAYIAVFNIFAWSYGLIRMSGARSPKAVFKAMLNPGIIGTIIGIALFCCSVRLPAVIASPISFLAGLNTPVPMLVIGYHLMNSNLKRVLRDADAYIAVAIRLIALPLAAMGVMLLLNVPGVIICSTVIAVSSPVAALTTMMSSKFGRDTELSAGIVSASTLISLITMPLVVGLTKYLAIG